MSDSHTHRVGAGSLRLKPRDRDVTGLGEGLAAARALSEPAHRLLVAADDIEGVTHERAVRRA